MFLTSRARLIAVGCGGFSGFIFTLSIPKAEVGILAWFCFLPALLAYRWTPDAAIVGLALGIVSGAGRIYWITETLQLFGGLGPLGAVATNVLLIVYMSLYPCLFFHIMQRIPPLDPRYPWVAASLWVFFEWLQGWIITGFPWELVGYTQYRFLRLAQVASLTGVYGLSFLIVLVNVALAQFAANRHAFRRLIAPAFLIGLALAYGQHRLDLLQEESDSSLSVGVIQGNFPQDIKWDKDRMAETSSRYATLARSLAESQPALVVFPETALPFRFRHPRYGDLRAKIEATATELKTPLLVGSLDEVKAGDSEALYNRAFLLDADGQTIDFSDKMHLVPFGEYIPFPSVFRYLEGLTTESGAFTHGAKREVMRLPGTTERFGVFICYEAIFPEIARKLVRGGATFLVNITNDAWFGRSAAPYQHLAMTALRAIETGRSVVRVANTGITCLIAPSGAISQATELFVTTAFVLGVGTRTETTTYTRIGDLFVFGCSLYLVLEVCIRWIPRRSRLATRS